MTIAPADDRGDFGTRGRDAARTAAARWWARLRQTPRGALSAAEAHERQHRIRNTWRAAARHVGLSEKVYSPSGVFWVEPRIMSVILGSPVPGTERFTIRLGLGQTYDQVAAAGSRIADFFDVRAIRLTELPGKHLEIELLPVLPPPPSPPGSAQPAASGPSGPAVVVWMGVAQTPREETSERAA